MDDKLDGFIDGIFGSNLIYISGALGIALVVTGIVLLARRKAFDTKRKKTAGVVCVIAGVGVILSGIVQTLIN